jgi:hypothetical protein
MEAIIMNAQSTKSNLLRRSLQADSAVSALSGLILIVAAKPLAVLLGVRVPVILIGLGISLLIYAAGLFRNARRESISQTEAMLTVILNGAWVVGSAIVIFMGVLTLLGNWLVAIVADVVLIFAVLQFWGIRKLRQAKL